MFSAICLSPSSNSLHAQPRLLDDFEDLSGWKPIASDGVALKLVSMPGRKGRALALDFEFHGGSGYAIAQKRLTIRLPNNYRFTFYLKGETPVNNFEFKLIDSLENVFWIKKLNIAYPAQWTKTTVKKRHISFAWGPSGGGEIRSVEKVEFVVSAGAGGKGRIYVDDFRLEPLDSTVYTDIHPTASASSSRPDHIPSLAVDGDSATCWLSSPTPQRQWLLIDLKHVREFGGVVIDWAPRQYATSYIVQMSEDGKEWVNAYAVAKGNGGRDHIFLHEAEARFIRLDLKKSGSRNGYGINNIQVKGVDFSVTPNAFFTAIAHDAPTGYYPKYLSRKQSYWTIVGASGDSKEALINEEGAIEVDKSGFSIEPFLYVDKQLITWSDVSLVQSLDRDYLPIPMVKWSYHDLELSVRAFAAGEAGKSVLVASYRVHNRGSQHLNGKLFLALRPFQVDPPWQELNIVGGSATIDRIRYEEGTVVVNQQKRVIPLCAPSRVGAAGFDQGDITEYLRQGELPPSSAADDHFGHASCALEYGLDLMPGSATELSLVIPFHDVSSGVRPGVSRQKADAYVADMLEATRSFWESKVSRVDIRLPQRAHDIVKTLKSNLAYICINRDGSAIQPGSRSYERAWIRDGSLTSAALLRMGNYDEVRDYVDWYARYQFPNGKIPCVVDMRGADPVPEHDSHGEFIYAVMQYFMFTHDTLWLGGKFQNIVSAVRYIQSLRAQRKTDVYRNGTPEQRACFGLVPESISHEGYSAKPMHSYWDDFFVIRGLKDATTIAGILGERQIEEEFARERDDFRAALYSSMRLAIANKKIDYVPGCVELGDFDATSTTIGVYPCGELGNIPEPQLANTFDKYFQFFVARRSSAIDWVNYTPYEMRIIGSFIYLDQKERAHELLKYFMNDRRPQPWNHWAEVVWRDRSAPRFIGDMPHTWVGSDFIRSVRAMFVYERESDDALVVGAGIADAWIDGTDGVEVKGLPTYYGKLSYTMKQERDHVVVELSGELTLPAGKIVLKSPLSLPLRSVIVDGVKSTTFSPKEAVIDRVPARVTLYY